ncbi:MAG: hypothetical protein IPL23_24275 [Saprospiraceae bacterium]|nr:hypothetical protein [Saprospiraceae bacterium]
MLLNPTDVVTYTNCLARSNAAEDTAHNVSMKDLLPNKPN